MKPNTCSRMLLSLCLSPALSVAGFFDGFGGPGLDPSWQVFEHTGPRVFGYTSPANHMSLSDSPGSLRYYLDPMTHAHGFETNMLPRDSYDAGLDLRRSINGADWTVESSVDYYLPFTNGRQFEMSVYFGEGDGSFRFGTRRGRDVNQNFIDFYVGQKDGDLYFNNRIAGANVDLDLGGPDFTHFFHRLIRAGDQLRGEYSIDGVTWVPALTFDVPGGLGGFDQILSINGGSWFNTGNSYAAYDYVSFNNVPEPAVGWLALAGLGAMLTRQASRR